MPLPKAEVEAGLVAELGNFETLVRSLSADEWAAPTRCEGWSVADVAAHVTGGMADVTSFRLEGLGTPEVTARQVEERRGRTRDEIADELAGTAKAAADLVGAFDDEAWAAPSPGGFDFTLGAGVEALWYDAYLHADDIRLAIGREPVGGPGLEASVSHIADTLTGQGWEPATIALDGIRELRVGDGSGRRLTGDPRQFVLAATGRADPSTIGLDETVNIYR